MARSDQDRASSRPAKRDRLRRASPAVQYMKAPPGSHGILKNPSPAFAIFAEFSPKAPQCDGAIKWDEKVIAEHDKLRGTRMKIDEPNTPYYLPQEPSMQDEPPPMSLDTPVPPDSLVPADILRERLEEIAMHELSDDSQEGAGEEVSREAKHARFEARRRAHYDEFRVLKQMRSSGSLEADE